MKNLEIKLYNSLTKQKEIFKPITPGTVTMYVCGPTVYDYVHIGNMRPVVVFDTLRRFFEYVGYEVIFVSNYTDVDDKIINKAVENNMSEREISEFYIEAYEQSVATVNAQKPSFTPRATEYVPRMIKFIKHLINRGAAYASEGDVFFRVDKVDHYGELSNINQEDLLVGARIEENSKKENPSDFLLWKKTDKGIKWDSPWGAGRPGWHTECVVMINGVFNQPLIDIHGGGFDLKFPHHDNEIAQSKASSGTSLANYWLHNGFINFDHQKMSKSLGNYITARDFLEQYGGPALRLLLLSSHYRAPVNINEEIIASTNIELEKITKTMVNLHVFVTLNNIKEVQNEALLDQFSNALADDLNTPNALSELYKVIKQTNVLLRNNRDLHQIGMMQYALNKMTSILGIKPVLPIISQEDISLFSNYENAKSSKNYAESDRIRQILTEKGLL